MVKQDHADAKHCLAKFKQALRQVQDVCDGLGRVSAGIGVLELAFNREHAFDRVSHHRFIAKVQMQIVRNALAGKQLLGNMNLNDLLSGVRFDMARWNPYSYWCRIYLKDR
jgi:hypothetical protein